MYLNGAEQFKDFELLDSGGGYRLERWGDYLLQRPDPQVIWRRTLPDSDWLKADAIYGDDNWHFQRELPESWVMRFQNMQLLTRPTNFKHTGVFPEQSSNWLWMSDRLAGKDKPKILNLFAYTGAATMWLTMRGAFVTHVDASRPAIGWAKENQALNNLPADSIRWILDDAAKFVRAEVKRSATYDGIVMDPPAFGHGPTGSIWKFNEQMPRLADDCAQLLSPEAGFFLINAYATNTSELAIQHLLEDVVSNRGGTVESGQLCLAQKSGRLLSTGIFTRWASK